MSLSAADASAVAGRLSSASKSDAGVPPLALFNFSAAEIAAEEPAERAWWRRLAKPALWAALTVEASVRDRRAIVEKNVDFIVEIVACG